MTALLNQYDFTKGELTPILVNRQNVNWYMRAAKKLRNVLVIPQGGCQRRFGTRFIDQINHTAAGEFKIVPFEYSETIHYVLVFIDSQILIYHDDQLVHTITDTVWDGPTCRELNFAQNHNLLVIVHPDHIPRQLVRGDDHDDWTLSQMTFKHIPAHDFNETDYSTYTFTLSAVSVGSATLTSSGDIFSSEYIGGLFIAVGPSIDNPLGLAYITAVSSATQATVDITYTFDSSVSSGVSGSNVVVAEPAWSTPKGWPLSVTFFQNRLVFGGCKAVPNLLTASKSGQFNNFDIGTGLPDDAVVVTLAGTTFNYIKHVIGNRTLQVFTNNAEWAVPQTATSALTPGSVALIEQTSNGSTDVTPIVLDNKTFYVSRGGKSIRGYEYVENTQAYNSFEVSLLAPHLINSPLAMTALKGSVRATADFLLVVNADGTLATFQSLSAEGVAAWTLCTTEGEFQDAVQVGDDVYFVIKRQLNQSEVFYLEKMDFDVYMDSTHTQTLIEPTTEIEGLEHLNGMTVQVRGDGFVMSEQQVLSGKITLERAVQEVEVGLGFDPLIETLPVVLNKQNGSAMYQKKRNMQVYVDYYESLGIYVRPSDHSEGEQLIVPYLDFGDGVLDQVPDPQTDIKNFTLLGWSRRSGLKIYQRDPLPMTLLGIGYEVI